MIVRTPQGAGLAAVLAAHEIEHDTDGDRMVLRGTTSAAVSQLAFDHGIRLVEITETVRSLEDSLLDLTGASAEFAAATPTTRRTLR